LIIAVIYTEGIPGKNLLAIHERDAGVIADLMMGNDGVNPPQEISEIYMSAVSEAMNQMMGTTATSLSNIFKKRVEIAPPKVGIINLSEGEPITDAILPGDNVVKISFRMEIGDLVDSEIMLILPLNLARSMVDGLLHADTPPTPTAAPAPVPAPQAVRPAAGRTASPSPTYAPPPPAMPRTIPEQHVSVQPAQFAPLRQTTIHAVDSNIDMIMDVSLQVTVELGRTRKLIREILELAPGSVVELDKLAGEPVDILVNGKIVAKGEVVVIDENFGVRITGIVSQQERATTLQ